jgi:hypothetical protein
MTLQYSTTLRTNQVGQIQTTVGAAGVLKVFSGAKPANCAAGDPAGLLATIALPAAFLTSAAGATALAGSWATTGSAAGTAASFRIYDSAANCHVQGAVTATGSGGDLTLDNTSIALGQPVTVTSCVVTGGNP